MKELKEVRQTLIEMLEDLDDRLGVITGAGKQNAKPVTRGSEVRVFQAEQKETTVFLRESVRQEMEQIKQALLRIDEGTYGICLSCGKIIKKQRLKENIFSSQCEYCCKKAEAFSKNIK